MPDPTQAANSWWHPARHTGRRPALLARGRLQTALRLWFAGQGFEEVDPAALQVSPGNEAHLHGFATELQDETGQGRPMYLHTSPEFAMKKLLAAGETRIFALTHVFRNRERTQRHSPEFTMLEWYRVGEDYTQLMQDSMALLKLACQAAGTSVLSWRSRTCDPALTPERLTVADAITRHANIDLLASIRPDGTTDTGVGAMSTQA